MIFEQLLKTPIYETEKLVELVESLQLLVPSEWSMESLEMIFNGDEMGLEKMIRRIRKNK